MTKAVGYTRVATQGQVRDGYSLAHQRDEIMRYCTDNDIEVLHIYEDKGISGAKVDEDGLTVERGYNAFDTLESPLSVFLNRIRYHFSIPLFISQKIIRHPLI